MLTTKLDFLSIHPQVCDHYRLQCLQLAVNVIDRFLSVVQLAPDDLQLYGAAAMLVASKLKDEDSPTLANICACAANAFTTHQLQVRWGLVLAS